MTERTHAHDHSRTHEGEQRVSTLTPATARLALIVVDTSFSNPGRLHVVSDTEKASWINSMPDALQPVIKAAEEVSWESREKYYQDDTRSAKEIHTTWNKNIWNAVHAEISDESVDSSIRAERISAYKALGLSVSDVKEHGLYKEVEDFRKKYVGIKGAVGEKRDIHQFIIDLSKDYQNTDGVTDRDKLTKRLKAIKPLLGIFGKDKSADAMITGLAQVHGMLTEKGQRREALADIIQVEIQKYPVKHDQAYLTALVEKMQKSPLPVPVVVWNSQEHNHRHDDEEHGHLHGPSCHHPEEDNDEHGYEPPAHVHGPGCNH
ncbi:MAG: hypothetical protein H0W89_05365 [Candidatus Levybacteria bacterium]|nr:hypothetical protein [Candidatus Levybacteria bacterium]